jgi:arylsulfatase A-like enzyme
MTTRRTWLALLLPCVLLVAAPRIARADGPVGKKKLNVLFIYSDDQRADTIAALGNKHIRTPNLDRLARGGLAFTRAYCMGARQGAVCVPSRAMLLSGRTLFRVDEKLLKHTTWPEAFARAGYVTFITGKWHNGAESVVRCFMQGKSIFLGGMGDPLSLPIADLTPDRKLTKARPTPKHSIAQFADTAIEFIRGQKGDRPFLAYVALNAPHDPRLAPKAYHEPYDAKKPPLPSNYLPQHPFNNGELVNRDERLAPWPRTPEVVRQHLADYYAAITFLDEQVGRIIDALKETGQYDNTIIVFTSDHGLAIGSHGLFGKQNLYDDSMRVPLIIAGPGIPRGQKTDAFAYLLDLYPTLGELTGVPGPATSEGTSLVPIIRGTSPAVRDTLFTAYRDFQRSVRDDRWHLIVYPQVNKTQLFDLKADPAETKDLAGTHAAEVRRLTGVLRDWQTRLGDNVALTSANPQPLEFDFSKVKPVPKKK